MVEFRAGLGPLSGGDAQRGVAFEGCVSARPIVVRREVGELAFEVTRVPEQDVVEKLAPRRPDEPLHKRVGHRNAGHGLDFIDIEHSEMRVPAVLLEQRVVIGTEMARGTLPTNGVVEHAAEAGAIDSSPLHAESDEAAGELVHDNEHPVAL